MGNQSQNEAALLVGRLGCFRFFLCLANASVALLLQPCSLLHIRSFHEKEFKMTNARLGKEKRAISSDVILTDDESGICDEICLAKKLVYDRELSSGWFS